MKKLIKSILSQGTINNFYHLPKTVLANVFYGFPAEELKVIGVTGTDGKTTTVNMIYQVLKEAGKKVSMISTINAVIGGKVFDTGFHVTSPDPFMVQKFAGIAKKHGDEYLVLEVTSHALDQYRFWGIKFDVGVITNITHEHLDYHKTFKNYLNTKLKLIRDVKYAIINDNLKTDVLRPARPVGGSWDKCLSRKLITFGLREGDFTQRKIGLKLKIPGDYNIENALAALGVVFVLGIDRNIALKTLEDFKGIAGRMEEIKNNKGIKIFIDFAHTPNALEQALRSLCSRDSQTRSGRLIAVFGSAGKRDVDKRGLMGEVAGNIADFLVVTAEDSRGEWELINRQIVEGAEKTGKTLERNIFVVEDRGEAISFAINQIAKKGDTIGIFGKGHETSMNLDGKKEIPWSDLEAVKVILSGSSRQ